MTTLATALLPHSLDMLLVFAAQANDTINAGEVRYRDRADFELTVAALRSRMPSLDGISIFPDSTTIVATRPARDALYNMLCAGGDTSFDAAIRHVTKALFDTLAMFSMTNHTWRTHPVFAGREHEWDFLGTDYVVLDWLVNDVPARFRFKDIRDGQSKAPEICTTGVAARSLAEGKLAFLVPRGQRGLVLVCPRDHLKFLADHYNRNIVAATMLIARLGFLSHDSGFCLDRSGALAQSLLALINLCCLAGFDMPENLDQTMAAYCNADDDPNDAAHQIQLRSQCITALLDYSRPWLHEEDSQLASLFRGWMVTVGPGSFVDRAAIICPGAAISGGCTIGAGAIVRNGAWVAPYAVLVADQIVTASGSIRNAGGNDVSSGDVSTRARNGGPSLLPAAPYQNVSRPANDIEVPFTIAKAPVGYRANSPSVARGPGSVSFWRYPAAGDLRRGGAKSGAQTTADQSPLSTTTSTSTPPPLSRKRPRPGPETPCDNAPPSSRLRTAPQGWPAPGASAYPYPESSKAQPRQFTWVQDPDAMPTRQSSTQPVPHFPITNSPYDAPPSPAQVVHPSPQYLEPEMLRSSTPPPMLWSAPAPSVFNPTSNYTEHPDSGFRIDATPPFVHNRELAYRDATTTEASAFLPNDILQFTRLPPPMHAPAPVLYSGRGNSRATPDNDAPGAPPPQPSPHAYSSPLQASNVGQIPATLPSVARPFMFKHS
jgi:hypothetical protein